MRILAVSLVLAALLYLGFALYGGLDRVAGILARLGLSGWLILLGCSLLNYLLRFLRWDYYLQNLGHTLPRGLHLGYYLAGFALTTSPGKAGETIRSLYLKAHQVPYTHSLASFFTERFLDVVVITLYATLIFRFDQQGHAVFILIVLIVLLLLLPLMQSNFPRQMFTWLGRHISAHRPAQLFTHIANLFHQARYLLSWDKLLIGLLLGALSWGVQGLAFYYLLWLNQVSLSPDTAIAIYALSLLAGALSFIPGGIGATEAVMSLLLIAHGVDKPTAVSLPIINRITTLWFAVVLGLLSNSWLSVQGIRVDHQQLDQPVEPQRESDQT